MDEQIKQIAERLKGLRDALDLSVEEVAADCNFTVEEYQAIESGECDFSVSVLQRIARKYGITLDELMFGEEPKMKSYFLTRRGTGVSVERTKAYKYQSLIKTTTLSQINSYNECALSKGSIIQESYPSTCVTLDGKRFSQKHSEEEKDQLEPPKVITGTEKNDEYANCKRAEPTLTSVKVEKRPSSASWSILTTFCALKKAVFPTESGNTAFAMLQ